MIKHRISIIGLGYVGLCTAVGFASKGYNVVTVDNNHEKVELVNKGIPPFYEANLKELIQKTLKNDLLKCTTEYTEAILESDITFIAVGTPSKPDGSINLQFVEDASRELGKALNEKDNYHLIVVKSTVTPGTTEKVVQPTVEKFSGKKCGEDFGLCVNPEFLREGSAIQDVLHPDRIVIGEYDKKSGDILENLYRSFYRKKTLPLIRTNLPTAELIKYANNAFLTTKISFINEIANICEKIPGTDVTVVAKAIGIDKRIGRLFLNAGLGYGGSCLPKDMKALITFSKDLGYEPKILTAVNELNENQQNKAIQLCKKALGNLENKRIAILGLAFKPNTDDLREATSIKIINALIKEKANLIAYDPAAVPNAKKIIGNKIRYVTSAIDCLKGADCCIIVTEWKEFKNLKPKDFIKNMKQPIVIDGRRIYDPKKFADNKLRFMAIGIGN